MIKVIKKLSLSGMKKGNSIKPGMMQESDLEPGQVRYKWV